ncbi:hypothetical protein N9N82_10435 [Luminiphilus sp.]|nr:hypothetical protein [Luminiphilus sp.]
MLKEKAVDILLFESRETTSRRPSAAQPSPAVSVASHASLSHGALTGLLSGDIAPLGVIIG